MIVFYSSEMHYVVKNLGHKLEFIMILIELPTIRLKIDVFLYLKT